MTLLPTFIEKHAFSVNLFVQAKPPPVNPIKESDNRQIHFLKSYV